MALRNPPFEKYDDSNPPKSIICKTAEKRSADGISGCCDRKVGATATHLAFSCLPLDPPLRGSRWGKLWVEHFPPSRPYRGFRAQLCPLFASRAKLPTQGDNGLHEGCIFASGKDAFSWYSSAAYVTGFLTSKTDLKISLHI